ncbi:CPBP family intramembrane metalloprotease [bacterium]|nr:CPBP family intramembrane metalloprotease [bacterium]
MKFEKPGMPRPIEAGIVLLLTLGFAFIITLISQRLIPPDTLFTHSKLFHFSEILAFVPLFIYVGIRRFSLRKVLRIQPITGSTTLLSIIIGLCATLLLAELDSLINLVFPLPAEIEKAIETMMRISTTGEFLLVLTSGVVVAGLCEEMLFRGFVQQAAENSRTDVTTAILLTSVIFALFHIPWWYLQTTVIGIILGVMAWKSNSILPGAIVHGINNGLNMIFINADEHYLKWIIWHENHIHPVLLLAAAVGIYWGFKEFYKIYAAPNSPQQTNNSTY